jgi:hypothetical protein
MSTYPGGVAVFPTRADGQTIFAQHLNAVQDEIAAIEASLINGALPSPQLITGEIPTLGLKDTRHAEITRLFSDQSGNANQTVNLNYAGSVWAADDVTAQSVLSQFQPSTGRLLTYNGPVGANPRALNVIQVLEPTGAIRERGRAAPMGDLVAIPYNASFFQAGGGGTWTVAAGDATTYAYSLVGKTLTVFLYLQTTTVAGAVTSLQVSLPAGMTSAGVYGGMCYVYDAGTVVPCLWRATGGSTVILIGKTHAFGTAFVVGTDTTYVIAVCPLIIN